MLVVFQVAMQKHEKNLNFEKGHILNLQVLKFIFKSRLQMEKCLKRKLYISKF